ncbi:rod shape-determining protein MreC [Chamaesiphon sp. VAR_48_metabat_135_sub]|uniref:rod shape-determining protein MreC n=1 Tax=Chamaesiphon sp. VAR_48_metabat_135_sub TaxID=2964699 RepID=UPI00286B5E3D|nr:rod shape-determining protein MreC [Chamaesiphon sp. VAR_48_metabat_135_sub]
MFTLRRWWDKNALKLAGFGTVIGVTYLVLQTQNALVFEAYNALSETFQPKARQIDSLKTARVEQLQNELQELKNQNQQLKQLAGYSASVPNKGILAPILLRSADNWWQQVVIGRGSSDGIAIDHIVVGIGGVVGRVVSVSPHTSRVLLVSDPNSRMGVLISRTRNMGILQGTRTNQAVLQFFDKRPLVKKGDVVSTSAVSQLFPTGLAVGRVIETNLNKSPAPEAIVEFTAPLGNLEWVTVHPHNPHAVEATPVKPPVTTAPSAPPTKPR